MEFADINNTEVPQSPFKAIFLQALRPSRKREMYWKYNPGCSRSRSFVVVSSDGCGCLGFCSETFFVLESL